MTHEHESHEHAFDQGYWEQQWQRFPGSAAVNPYLVREADALVPGAALDVGCGAGVESLWLAERGWSVTGVDISAHARAAAEAAATARNLSEEVTWVRADVTRWHPERRQDLVVTCYAHAQIPQLQLYRRVSDWVSPGGNLLIVAHRNAPGRPAAHPDKATATAAEISALFADWRVEVAEEYSRTTAGGHGAGRVLFDTVVRARRPLG